MRTASTSGRTIWPSRRRERSSVPNGSSGLSTHSPEQIDAAADAGVDYIGVGPVHATPTKPGRPAVGVELVTYAAAHAQPPFFAIGGINPSNVDAVVDAGAERIVVVRALTESANPSLTASVLRTALRHREGSRWGNVAASAAGADRRPQRALRRRRARPTRQARRSSEERNAAVRARLTPFAAGERPAAIKISVAVALLLGLSNLVLFIAGVKPRVGSTHPHIVEILVFSGLMIMCASGMWLMRYWAVLGFQTLLAIGVLGFSLALVRASTILGAVICVVVVGAGGIPVLQARPGPQPPAVADPAGPNLADANANPPDA